jgi:hypothetical protein
VVNRAANVEPGAVADVSVNHRGGDIFVPEELLDGPDIIAILQKMGSETVPKGVAARRFGDPAGPNSILDRVLQVSFRGMVPAFFSTARIDRDLFGGEDVLPGPFTSGVGIFPVQGVGKINGAAAAGEVLMMEFLDPGEVRLQRGAKAVGQNGHSLPHTLAFSNGDLPIPEIDVFDAETETFEEPQTASVEEMSHDPIIPLQMGENAASFGSSKDDGKPGRAANPLDRDKFEFPIEHLLEEKKQRAQGLVLGGGGDISLNREVG